MTRLATTSIGGWLRRKSLILGLGVLSAAAPWLWPEPLEQAEYQLTEISQELRGPRPAPPELAIVAIDDFSLQQTANAALAEQAELQRLQSWPWPRATYALVLDRLFESGAKAVGFDLLFDTPSGYGPADDQAFAQGLRKHRGKVVLGAQVLESRGSVAGLRLASPVQPLAQVPQGLLNGFLNPDGSIRLRPDHYAEQLRQTLGPQVPPSLGSALLQQSSQPTIETTTRTGWRPLLDPYGPPRTIETIPIWELLEPRSYQHLNASGRLRNRLVLVGPTAAIFQDLHHTPFAGTEGMPGVEIHATELGNRLEQRVLWLQPRSIAWSLFTGASVIGVGLLSQRWTRPLRRLGITGAIAAALVVSGVLLISQGGIALRVISLSLGTLAVGVVSSAEATVNLQLNRRRLKRSLSRYLSPAVASEIANQPEEADGLLGGKLTEVVVLMTDIRGFTAYTQAMSSSGRVVELVERLNVYFSEVVEALHGQGATVDKFIGDATLAVFGAPIHRGNQAEASAAIEAALEIEARLRSLNQTWEQQGETSWQQVIVLSFGTVISGNIGSSRRMDYTVIGDAVNTASRLEAVAKQCQRTIVMSQGVADLVRDQWPLEDLGRFEIRGQTAQHVYALASVTNPVPKAADRS
ncbi:MAG: CHASE2 domain-containing protein [Vulcanococcus sp.]